MSLDYNLLPLGVDEGYLQVMDVEMIMGNFRIHNEQLLCKVDV